MAQPSKIGWMRKKKFIRLYMDLTQSCNIHCIHCFRETLKPKPARITPTRLAILERDLFPYVSLLALSETGESLYVRLLPQALAAAKRAGVPFIHIQSNGTHLSPEVSHMLLDEGLDALGISLDAATKETFEAIRVGAQWEKVIENIRGLVRQRQNGRKSSLRIAFNYAIMEQNAAECLDFLHLAKELQVDSVSFTHLFVEREEMRDWSLIYDTQRANQLCEEIRREAEKLNLPVAVPFDLPNNLQPFSGEKLVDLVYRGFCSAAHESWIFLRANGNCYPCFNLQDSQLLGNIFDTSFRRIWNDPKNLRWRERAIRKGEAVGCDHCKFFTKSEDLNSEMAYLAKRLTTQGWAEREW